MNFVSAVDIRLLTSFWICLWFSHAPGLTVLLLGAGAAGKKKLPPDFKPDNMVLQVFQDPAGRGGLGSIFFFFFSFPVVPQGWRLSLGYSNHRCPVSSPRPQSTVQPMLSTLRIGARLVLIIHLLLHPFEQSMRCTEWEQIMLSLLPLCWPGCCLRPLQSSSVPLEVFLGATARF